MKRIYLITVLISSAFLFHSNLAHAQGVAINATGAAADPSAMLDVSTTSQGLLPPRMTTAQKNAIANPANGLIVYQTDSTAGLYCNEGTTTAPLWQLIGPKTTPAYGYLYSTTQQVASSFPGAVFFHIPGSNQIYDMDILIGDDLFVLTTGVYHVTYLLTVQNISASSESITAAVYNNSTAETPSSTVAAAGNATVSISGELFLSLNAGDDISLQVSISSGAFGYINSCSFTAVQLK